MPTRIEPRGFVEMPDPYSIEDEIALLGCMLGADSRNVLNVALLPEDFYIDRHGWYWAAMREIAEHDGEIEPVALKNVMNGHFEESGGFGFYAELASKAGSFLNVDIYAEHIRDLALRRRVKNAGLSIARMAGTPANVTSDIPYHGPPTLTSQELIDTAFKTLEGLAPISDRPLVTMSSAISGAYDRRLELMRRRDGSNARRPDVPTGFPSIDQMTDYAFAPGVLALIIALPKMGKTTLALQIMLEAASHGMPVVYATYEMAVERLTDRAWSVHSGVPESALRDGRILSDDQESALAASLATLAELPIQYVNTPLENLMADVQAAQDRHGRKCLLIVDNVNSAGKLKPDDNQQANISDNLGILDQIKLRAGCAVLGLAHQRDDYDKSASMERLRALLRPNLFNTFGSRAAMRYGELVMGLWRPEVISQQIAGFDDSLGEDGTPNGAARLFMLATRYGPSDGTCKLRFNASVPRFENAVFRHVDFDHDIDDIV